MKRAATMLLALASTVILIHPLSASDTNGLASLPRAVRADLDRQYPGWELYDLDAVNPGERKYCAKNPQWTSFVRADFNGDGHTDYAVLIEHHGHPIVLAFLARGKAYTRIPVIEAQADALGVTPRGTSYVTSDEGAHAPRRVVLTRDVLVVYRCEADTSQYIFKKGHFQYQE